MTRFITPITGSHSCVIRIIDATNGAPETGVTTATPGLALYYRREPYGLLTAITPLADLALLSDPWSDPLGGSGYGFLHISDGYYRVDLPDDIFVTWDYPDATSVLITGTATDMIVIGTEIQLSAPQAGDSYSRIADNGEGLSKASSSYTGVPTALDGSGTTLAAMLRKMAADDNGNSFDATTDSLHAIRAALTVLGSTGTVTIAQILSGTTITVLRGDTLSIAITGLGSIVGYKKVWFTVKRSTSDVDANAILQTRVSAPADPGDGLLYLNGEGSAVILALGTIAVTDAADGDVLITIAPGASSQLEPTGSVDVLSWDIQWRDANDHIHTPTAGTMIVVDDVSRATS